MDDRDGFISGRFGNPGESLLSVIFGCIDECRSFGYVTTLPATASSLRVSSCYPLRPNHAVCMLFRLFLIDLFGKIMFLYMSTECHLLQC